MKIQEIRYKEEWERFFEDVEDKTFLQSWNWGEFWQKTGKIWRLGIYGGDTLIGVALIVKVQARRGTFLLIQHGPVLKNFDSEILQIFLRELKQIAKEEGASFVRMNPLWERTARNIGFLKEHGLRESPMHANAYEATWKLDLAPSEDELVVNMRKTTRYLMRQAQKNSDIAVEKSNRIEDVNRFAALTRQVARRQQFVPFSEEYIKNEFEVFAKDSQALLVFGKYKGEYVAGTLVIFWSGVGFYHQAASLSEYAKLSIPYLVQWEAIKEAKRRGCKLYDFWGYVDPGKYPRHPWAGPTLFKMGFGGKVYEYIKTQDYPLSVRYWPIAVFEMMRAKRRGL